LHQDQCVQEPPAARMPTTLATSGSTPWRPPCHRTARSDLAAEPHNLSQPRTGFAARGGDSSCSARQRRTIDMPCIGCEESLDLCWHNSLTRLRKASIQLERYGSASCRGLSSQPCGNLGTVVVRGSATLAPGVSRALMNTTQGWLKVPTRRSISLMSRPLRIAGDVTRCPVLHSEPVPRRTVKTVASRRQFCLESAIESLHGVESRVRFARSCSGRG
jgi:hypothetical protein